MPEWAYDQPPPPPKRRRLVSWDGWVDPSLLARMAAVAVQRGWEYSAWDRRWLGCLGDHAHSVVFRKEQLAYNVLRWQIDGLDVVAFHAGSADIGDGSPDTRATVWGVRLPQLLPAMTVVHAKPDRRSLPIADDAFMRAFTITTESPSMALAILDTERRQLLLSQQPRFSWLISNGYAVSLETGNIEDPQALIDRARTLTALSRHADRVSTQINVAQRANAPWPPADPC